MDHSVNRRTGGLKETDLSVEKCFRTESLQNLQSFLNSLKENHAIALFMERIPWTLLCFYPNSFIVIFRNAFYNAF